MVSQDGHRVLVSGCAHNGILNILDRYRDLFGGDPDVVISGFHMMKKQPYDCEELDVIDETARELARHNTVFYTGHCTGLPAFERMQTILGGAAPPAAQRGGTGPRNPVKPLVPGCPDSRKTPLPLRCLRGGFLLHIFEDCVKFRAEKRI